jgi:hypothetical protein
MAIARPMPLAAPVTTTTLFRRMSLMTTPNPSGDQALVA